MRLFYMLTFGLGAMFLFQKKIPAFLIIDIHVDRVQVDTATLNRLNKKFSLIKNEQEAVQFLDSAFARGGIYVQIKFRHEQTRNSIGYVNYIKGDPGSYKEIRVPVKADKTVYQEPVIKYKSQFKEVFSESLAILGNLTAEIELIDYNYPIKGYYLKQLCNGCADILPVYLPSKGKNEILISSNILPAGMMSANYSLFNEGNRKEPLSTFKLNFIPEEEKQSMVRMYTRILDDNSGDSTFKKIDAAVHLQKYIEQEYGNIQLAQVTEWLDKVKL